MKMMSDRSASSEIDQLSVRALSVHKERELGTSEWLAERGYAPVADGLAEQHEREEHTALGKAQAEKARRELGERGRATWAGACWRRRARVAAVRLRLARANQIGRAHV